MADRARLAWYVDQVRASRELVYEFCRGTAFTSGRAAPTSCSSASATARARCVDGLAARAASTSATSRGDPGCDGCIRVTTGIVEHTRRCLDAMEEVLCGAG